MYVKFEFASANSVLQGDARSVPAWLSYSHTRAQTNGLQTGKTELPVLHRKAWLRAAEL